VISVALATWSVETPSFLGALALRAALVKWILYETPTSMRLAGPVYPFLAMRGLIQPRRSINTRHSEKVGLELRRICNYTDCCVWPSDANTRRVWRGCHLNWEHIRRSGRQARCTQCCRI